MQVAATQSMELQKPGAVVVSSLDSLANLDWATLGDLYRRAEVPSVPELDGDLRGRMLAVRGTGRIWFGLLRAFAAWHHFPWRGKSFWSGSRLERGDGINRVFGSAGGVTGAPVPSRRWFRFETFIGPSRADSGQAFQLDYDNRDNPFFIRAIKDEVRQVAPGLFLGQAYLRLLGKPRLILYFALGKPGSLASPLSFTQ
jgi:hypothetical protein